MNRLTSTFKYLKQKAANFSYRLAYKYLSIFIIGASTCYAVYKLRLILDVLSPISAFESVGMLPLLFLFAVLIFVHTLIKGGIYNFIAIVLAVTTALLI